MFVEVLVSIADIDSYDFPRCALYNIAIFWLVLNYSLGSLENSVDLQCRLTVPQRNMPDYLVR